MGSGLKSELPDYQKIYQKFGPERILERKEFIYVFCEYWADLHGLRADLFISPDLIQEIVLNYFADIGRYKDFHEIDRANTIKIAAYTTFWFLRAKPIQIKEACTNITPILRYMNEYCAYGLMNHIVTDRLIIYQDPPTTTTLDFAEECIYSFIYRLFTPQTIELAIMGFLAVPTSPFQKEFDGGAGFTKSAKNKGD